MRRILFFSLALMAVLGFVAPPDAFAQAAAPKPTFTITGLIDNVGTFARNISSYDANIGRNADSQMYGRTRGRFDIIGEVGSAKGVFGFEIDSYWGQTGFADSNMGPGCQTGGGVFAVQCGATGSGAESSFDMNTDTQGNLQVKWLYVEFPLPLVPFSTIVRLGAQPFATAANYKLAVYANGDFPGVNLYTTFSPTFKLQLTYVAIDENLTGKKDFPPFLTGGAFGATGYFGSGQGKCVNQTPSTLFPATGTVPCQAQNRGDNFAIIISPEITPMKGLDIKPMFSYVFINGQTTVAVRQGRGGVNANTILSGTAGTVFNSPFAPAGGANGINGLDGGGTGNHENRFTVGVDSRYRMGPLSIDPTFLHQFGSQQKWLLGGQSDAYGRVGTKKTADISAWLVDVRGSYQLGPLLLSSMVMWTSGQDAKSSPYRSIKYFTPLDTDTSYGADWGTQIFSLGVDYYQILNGAGSQPGMNNGVAIGYDKYGRIQFGAKAAYAVTPALTVGFGVTPNWTDKKVDTDGFLVFNGGIQPAFICRKTGQSCRPEGESQYLGTELNTSLTYRFAPGLTFDWALGYLFAGNALGHRRIAQPYNVTPPSVTDIGVSDVMITTARVRFSF